MATNVYAPDGLVGRTSGGTTRQYLFDVQGNVAHAMTSSSAVSMSAAYTAWGQRNYVYPFQAPSQWDDCFGYNARWGYVKDATGLYYCQNRYYDPANGRWLTRDPIGFSGGINLYGYCGGGPVGAVDPEGLCEACNFVAGWGDTLTFGLTKIGRRALGEALGIGDANESVDYHSIAYNIGEGAGVVNQVGAGVARGVVLAGKRPGTEFSHFIGKSFLRKMASRLPAARAIAKKAQSKCWWNGNYVSPWFHSFTDPFRYLKGQTKATKLLVPILLRPFFRAPFPITLGGASGLTGAGHVVLGREH